MTDITYRTSVAVIMLTVNQRETTLRALASFDDAERRRAHVLVWDNGSTDGTAAAVRERFPDVHVHRHDTNLGVASGRNAAAAHAMALFAPTHLLFVDNDLVVTPGFVDALLEPFDRDEHVGQTQAKLRSLQEPHRLNDGGGCRITFWLGRTRPVGFGEVDDGRHDRVVPCVSCGGAMMTRADVFQELGGFDTAFDPFGPEDLDYSLRLQKRGYRALYVPRAMAYHEVSHTFGGGQYTAHYARVKAQHWLRFLGRHGSSLEKVGFALVGAPLILIRMAVREGRKGNPGALLGSLAGVLAGLRRPRSAICRGGAAPATAAGRRPDEAAPAGPLVSVVVAFLNEEQFLEEAITSVYAQTYRNWELLLVDDGSTDGSPDIARRHAARDPGRVRYLHHPGHENRGVSAARNLGVTSARGEWIALLDADDVSLPERLQRSVDMAQRHPEADMIYGRSEYWSSWQGDGTSRDRVQPHHFRAERLVRPPELLVRHLSLRAALPGVSSLLIRRQAYLGVGGFEEGFRGLVDDAVFLGKFCLRHAVYVSEECWDRYRQHPGSDTAVAATDGRMRAAHRSYLAWLNAYVAREAPDEDRVRSAAREALRRHDRPRDDWRARLERRLRVAGLWSART